MQEHIVHQLKNHSKYLSGEEISRTLNISRAGIWKHMEELRKQGYDIEAVPHLGYKLISVPDRLLPQEVSFNLNTKIVGKKVIYHDSVPSTMDAAFQLGVEGAEEGTVVCAEIQTKGRGRLGRSWVSPKGKGIYMSLILRPKLPPVDLPRLTLLCAVAVCETIRQAGVQAEIKWPNDILVHQKKLAGILTEMNAEVDRVKFVVVGIGLNVNTTAATLPPEGTSLKIEAKKNFSRVEILQDVLRSLDHWYEIMNQEGFVSVLARWKELSATLGKRVKLSDFGGHVEGEAFDLAPDGGLMIRNDQGVVVKRMSGDVVPVS